jgi:hypothetical protein
MACHQVLDFLTQRKCMLLLIHGHRMNGVCLKLFADPTFACSAVEMGDTIATTVASGPAGPGQSVLRGCTVALYTTPDQVFMQCPTSFRYDLSLASITVQCGEAAEALQQPLQCSLAAVFKLEARGARRGNMLRAVQHTYAP